MKKKHVIESIIFLTYALFAMSWVAGSTLTMDIMAHFVIDNMATATGNISIAAYFAVACSSSFFLASFFLPETGRQEGPSPTLSAEDTP